MALESLSPPNVKVLVNSKLAGVLSIAIALIGLFAPSLFDVEATAPLRVTATVFGLPITCLCLYFFLFKLPPSKPVAGRIAIAVFALWLAGFIVVVISGYVAVANVLGPVKRVTLVQGRITHLTRSGYKFPRYRASIADATGRRTDLNIEWAEYQRLSVGQIYSEQWKVGALGILYK